MRLAATRPRVNGLVGGLVAAMMGATVVVVPAAHGTSGSNDAVTVSLEGGTSYVPLTPTRILDTRDHAGGPIGSPAQPVGAGESRAVTVTGVGGVPESGVGAVVVNVTAVNATTNTFVTVYPSGDERPDASTFNPRAGGVIANEIIAPVGDDGQVQVYNHNGEVDILLDVVGHIPEGDIPCPDPAFDATWVAAGVRGRVAVSADGTVWSSTCYPFGNAVNGVAHDGVGRWVGVGEFGEVATSTDGWNWSVVDYPHDGDVRAVAHDGIGRWVAVGRFGQVATSTDGVSWSAVDYPHAGSVNTVAHDGEGRWVAAGVNGEAATSTDGLAWTAVSIGFFENRLNGVAHDGQGGWVAVGAWTDATTSSDGVVWSYGGGISMSVALDIAHDQQGRWVTVGWHGAVATSTLEVIGWDQVAYPHDRAVHGVAHDGDNRWIAVGAGATVARSNDGQIWTTVSYPHTGHINTIAADRSEG